MQLDFIRRLRQMIVKEGYIVKGKKYKGIKDSDDDERDDHDDNTPKNENTLQKRCKTVRKR